MEKLVSTLIRNATGKTLTYETYYMNDITESWFMNATFDGKTYRVITFCEDGVVKMYKKHPINQNGPTHIIKFFCA